MKTTQKKFLKLEKLAEFKGIVSFKVAEQSHINDQFGNSGDCGSNWKFVANNGVILCSSACPEIQGPNFLYVRGYDTDRDNKVLMAEAMVFAGFEQAVKEYNKHFSKPPFEKIVMFRYDGGSTGDYRRISVTEETRTHIKGIDLDNENAFRCFKKNLISGEILTVKD